MLGHGLYKVGVGGAGTEASPRGNIMTTGANSFRKSRYLPLLVLGLGVMGGTLYSACGPTATGGAASGEKPAEAQNLGSQTGDAQIAGAQLVGDRSDTLRLEPVAAKALGVVTAEVRAALEPRPLELQGSLALDTNHLVRLHSRFPGEVIELAEIPDENAVRRAGKTVLRAVGFGDAVHKGELLAVVWCKDLGEKKSELADALSQLHFDQEQLSRLSQAVRDGAISDARLQQQQRNVEADLTAVARAERTLRVWRLPESEVDAVKEEARKIRERKGKRDPEKEKDWARVEVCAPFDGVVVEKNVAMGDIIDTTNDLFKIANVDTLTVWANAYEESLPALLNLPAEAMRWTIRLNADPDAAPLEGRIDKVGYISDPAQHTVMVMGRVDNPGGRLRAGQFITATVRVPPSPHEVVVPAVAVVEDGHESIAFVQPDPKQPCYTLRRVAVAWRSQKEVHVRATLGPDERAHGLQPLQPGERVVANAAIQLKSALEGLATAAKVAR